MKIEIKNLSFKAIIGILDFERVKKQRVKINLVATYDYKKNEFIDYVEIKNLVKKTVKKKKFLLLEDALNHLAKKLKKKFPQIKTLYIKISKPNILKDCQVSISQYYEFRK